MRYSIRATVVFACAVFLLAVITGCGDKQDTDAQLRRVTDSVQDPLDRLDDAVMNARPSSRTSMVTLRATAERAQDAVRTARGELQNAGDSARVRNLAGLLQDLQALTGVLAASHISAAELEVTGEKARQAVEAAATALPTIDVSRLAAALRRQRNGRALTQNGVSKPVGPSTDSGAQAVSYMDYTGPAFNAKLPTGAGWAAPAQSQPNPGRLFRTSVRGPNGVFAIIDYTPTEPARFGSGYQSRTVVGQTAFGTATKYVFQGGRLPECQRSTCVDYIINDPSGGGGFGVLAGGGNFATAAAVAQTIAESVTPVGD